MLRSIAMTVMMLGISPAEVSFAEDAAAEGPIRAVVAEQVLAWNAGDGQAYARHLAPRCVVHESIGDGHVRRAGVRGAT